MRLPCMCFRVSVSRRRPTSRRVARFDLTGIPAAPRGAPQIEVTFDMDANGILHVSAKDKATAANNAFEIKAGSGLSDEEIENMVRDAETHREEDKRFHELVNARNQADGIAHGHPIQSE